MIDALSNKLTSLIKENVSDISPEKEEIINYGIKIIFFEIITLLIMFSIAIVSGLFKYIFISYLVYSSLRVTAGGAHSRSRIECTIINLFILFGTVFLSHKLWADSCYPSIVVLIANLIILYIYAPGDTAEKPILSHKMKKRLKTASILHMLILFIIAIIIWHFDKIIYNIIIITTIPVMFFLTRPGYNVLRCKHGLEDT